MLSVSLNPILPSTHIFSGESFINSPRSVIYRHQKSLPVAAAYYTSAPPEREVASSSPSLKLKTGGAMSFYQVLEIPMGSTNQEIKSAYRRLARIFHPDVATMDRKSFSEGEFIKIHAAYDTLSDPGKRLNYDRQLLGRCRRTVLSSTESRFYGYAGRNWETDQCW